MFFTSWGLAEWAAIAAIVAVPLTLWPLLAPRFSKDREYKRTLLDALPNTREIPSPPPDEKSIFEYLKRFGTDISALRAEIHDDNMAPYTKALKSLIKQHKVQGVLVNIVFDDGPAEVIGKRGEVVFLFKGGIDPLLRTDAEELVKHINL